MPSRSENAATHDPACATLNRSLDPGPEGTGRFDERGWYYGACDCLPSRSENAAELTPDEERELAGVWLSRVMFGRMVDPALAPLYAETRTFEQFLSERQRSRLT